MQCTLGVNTFMTEYPWIKISKITSCSLRLFLTKFSLFFLKPLYIYTLNILERITGWNSMQILKIYDHSNFEPDKWVFRGLLSHNHCPVFSGNGVASTTADQLTWLHIL